MSKFGQSLQGISRYASVNVPAAVGFSPLMITLVMPDGAMNCNLPSSPHAFPLEPTTAQPPAASRTVTSESKAAVAVPKSAGQSVTM